MAVVGRDYRRARIDLCLVRCAQGLTLEVVREEGLPCPVSDLEGPESVELDVFCANICGS